MVRLERKLFKHLGCLMSMARILPTIILMVLLMVLVIGCSVRPTHQETLQLNLRDHDNMAMHIHPILEIEVMGQKQAIPTDIGISAAGMRPIHTHDGTGKLHVEAPYVDNFYLKDFFQIWGQAFNETQIFSYKADEKHRIMVYVNDQPDTRYGDILLRDDDKIKIVYEAK